MSIDASPNRKSANGRGVMKVQLLRDIYRYEPLPPFVFVDGAGQESLVSTAQNMLVFARKGDILETGPLSDVVDFLCGCRTAELVTPLDDGRVSTLGEGIDFQVIGCT